MINTSHEIYTIDKVNKSFNQIRFVKQKPSHLNLNPHLAPFTWIRCVLLFDFHAYFSLFRLCWADAQWPLWSHFFIFPSLSSQHGSNERCWTHSKDFHKHFLSFSHSLSLSQWWLHRASLIWFRFITEGVNNDHFHSFLLAIVVFIFYCDTLKFNISSVVIQSDFMCSIYFRGKISNSVNKFINCKNQSCDILVKSCRRNNMSIKSNWWFTIQKNKQFNDTHFTIETCELIESPKEATDPIEFQNIHCLTNN